MRREFIEQAVVGDHHAHRRQGAGDLGLAWRDDQQDGPAVVDPQAQSFQAEQREQWHAYGARLHRAEQADIVGKRRLQHEGHAISSLDASRPQPVGEPRGPGRDLGEGEALVAVVRGGDTDRHPLWISGVTVDALVGHVEPPLVAVEQIPQGAARVVAQRILAPREVRQLGHEPFPRRKCGAPGRLPRGAFCCQ
jgi:hypothetical protein